MSTYVPSFKGYIADVPEFWFKDCQGRVYHNDQLTSCSFQPEANALEINGGWQLYPVTRVPDRSNLTVDVQMANFDADLFAVMNGVQYKDENYALPSVSKIYHSLSAIEDTEEVQSDVPPYVTDILPVVRVTLDPATSFEGASIYGCRYATIPTIPQTPSEREALLNDPDYVEIEPNVFVTSAHPVIHVGDQYWVALRYSDGLTKDNYIDFLVDFLAQNRTLRYVEQIGNELIIHLNFGPIQDTFTWFVESVEELKQAKVIQVDNRRAGIGEALLRWPVYSTSEDCTASGIKGYVVVKIYKCKVSQTPGFDTSYKQSSTFGITLSGMDAKRSDRCVWAMAYMPTNFVNNSLDAGGVPYWPEGRQTVVWENDVTVTANNGRFTVNGTVPYEFYCVINSTGLLAVDDTSTIGTVQIAGPESAVRGYAYAEFLSGTKNGTVSFGKQEMVTPEPGVPDRASVSEMFTSNSEDYILMVIGEGTYENATFKFEIQPA